MKKYGAFLFVAAVCFVAAFASGPSVAKSQHADLEKFFGKYAGRSISVEGEGLSDRDFSVKISAHGKNGFTLDWTTVIRYISGKAKQKSFSINFLPFKKRPGIYYSAMEKNIFGKQAPADPLSGKPYVWAGIENDTLKVTALYIVDDGGYELQFFKRTLTPGGMTTHFERIRNGEKLRVITGKLEKTAN
ncbi:MAG: hypothetical protein OEM91_01790 [Hyphomicrobiales bacterium]|nr:hypothetical protein [Hyphomicrobiales bacterium]